jgi:hypothetical protein
LRKYIAYDSVRKISNDIQVAWPDIIEYYSDSKTKDFVKIIAKSKPTSKNYLKLIFYYENKKLIKAKVKERVAKSKIYEGSNIESILYYYGNTLLKKTDLLEKIIDPKVYFHSAYQFANYKPS